MHIAIISKKIHQYHYNNRHILHKINPVTNGNNCNLYIVVEVCWLVSYKHATRIFTAIRHIRCIPKTYPTWSWRILISIKWVKKVAPKVLWEFLRNGLRVLISMFSGQIKFDSLQQWRSYRVLTQPPSDFRVVKNMCTVIIPLRQNNEYQ